MKQHPLFPGIFLAVHFYSGLKQNLNEKQDLVFQGIKELMIFQCNRAQSLKFVKISSFEMVCIVFI